MSNINTFQSESGKNKPIKFILKQVQDEEVKEVKRKTLAEKEKELDDEFNEIGSMKKFIEQGLTRNSIEKYIDIDPNLDLCSMLSKFYKKQYEKEIDETLSDSYKFKYIKYTSICAEQNSTFHLNGLGTFYMHNGEYSLGKYYLEKGVELNDYSCMNNLGCYYQKTKPNPDKMFELYYKIIELGICKTHHTLTNISVYYRDIGNDCKAAIWEKFRDDFDIEGARKYIGRTNGKKVDTPYQEDEYENFYNDGFSTTKNKYSEFLPTLTSRCNELKIDTNHKSGEKIQNE